MNKFSEDNKEKNSQYSDTIKWTIAAYAPTLAVTGLNPLLIGGISKKDLSNDFIKEKLDYLKEEWGIIDKETAEHCMITLFSGRRKFGYYQTHIGTLIKEINSDQIDEDEDYEDDDEDDDDDDEDDDDEDDDYEDDDDDNDDDDEKRSNILEKSACLFVLQKYPEVGIIGSDLTEGIYLASLLYLVDIYSFEETMGISVKMAKKLQKSFNNWDDYMENVFWGYQCECGLNPYSDTFLTKGRRYYYNQKEIKNGIYSLDWNTPLEDEWETHILSYSDSIKWFNAAKALLYAINRTTPQSYLATGTPRPSYKKQAAQSLIGSWGVHNRYDAEQIIKRLLQGKVHNEKLLQESEQIKEISFNEYTKQKTLSEYIERISLSEYMEYVINDDILDDEYILNEYSINNHTRHFNLIHTIRQNYGEKGIIAWDLFRAIYLAADFYTIDYLTYEESLNASLIAAKKLQENFNSWDDYMNNYFLGYQYWSRDILENPLENPPLPENGMLDFNESGTAFRKKLYQWLKNEEDSVFDIPWNTELKKEW